MIKQKKISQVINYLAVEPKGRDPKQGFLVSHRRNRVEIFSPPLCGMANVRIINSALCGSDGGESGYFWGGRYHSDLFKFRKKLARNLKIMFKRGVRSNKTIRQELIKIPNHEGWGVVKAANPNFNDNNRKISAFVPELSADGKNIVGVKHQIVEIDPQQLAVGDWVVITAYLNCDQHWKIPKKKLFPDKCHRDTANEHVSKQVPGHGEMYGLSFNADYGLPFPNHMLVRVPDRLRQWLEKKEERKGLLVAVEPLSCCFEAFSPIILATKEDKEKQPKRIAILGDGANAALLTFTAVTVFPKAEVFVTGRTRSKLDAIAAIKPQNVHPILTDRHLKESGYSELKKRMFKQKGNANVKIDVLIPTYRVDSLRHYSNLVDYDKSWVIVWAADQVGDYAPFEGVVRKERIHHSYGGWNWAEWTALNFMECVAGVYPERLEALSRYPYHYLKLDEAATVMNDWLENKGRHLVSMDGRQTSSKIVINH